MTKSIDTPHLYALIKLNGVEELINSIDIESVVDHNIKVILRTIQHSIQSLYNELASDIIDHK